MSAPSLPRYIRKTLVMSDKSDGKTQFDIQTLGDVARNRPEEWDVPQRSESFEIVWIKKGSGVYLIDLEKHVLMEDRVFCIDVGQLHFLQANTDLVGYRLSFSPLFLSLSGSNSGCHPDSTSGCWPENNGWSLFDKRYCPQGTARIILVDDELKREMEIIFQKMIAELTGSSSLRSDILKGWLKILMIRLARRLERKSPVKAEGRNTELIQRFLTLLERDLTKRKSVGHYARDLGVTPNYLNEVVKRLTGSQAYSHIQQRKVLEAKRQAIYKGMNMKEVADYLGFEDQSHFSRFFKDKSGSNFTEFKKEVQATQYGFHMIQF